jgi:DNA polymerase-3 subunit delta'
MQATEPTSPPPSPSSASRATELLRRSVAQQRLAHAYLLIGTRLAAIETLARSLATTLTCKTRRQQEHPDANAQPCGSCYACRANADDLFPDVVWVRPESKLRVILIRQIRELQHTIHLKPAQGGYKVGIIVDADRLNAQAANAFLKTLEEPPAHSLLLLLTTAPEQLLDTIVSRCLRVHTDAGEAPHFDAEDLAWVEHFSRAAADQPKSVIGRYRVLGVLLRRLAELRELIEKELEQASPLERFPDAEANQREKWEDELKASIEAEYRRRRASLLNCLQLWLRDVWVRTLGAAESSLALPSLSASSAAVARRLAPETASANLRLIDNLQRLLSSNVQESLAIEVTLLKLTL